MVLHKYFWFWLTWTYDICFEIQYIIQHKLKAHVNEPQQKKTAATTTMFATHFCTKLKYQTIAQQMSEVISCKNEKNQSMFWTSNAFCWCCCCFIHENCIFGIEFNAIGNSHKASIHGIAYRFAGMWKQCEALSIHVLLFKRKLKATWKCLDLN